MTKHKQPLGQPLPQVLVVGAGYVGLTTSVCLAALGNNVVCVDNDFEKIKSITSGSLPIYEPGLLDLLIQGINQNKLKFSTDLVKNSSDSDFIFLCLPTPPQEDGTADLTHIFQVLDSISGNLKDNTIIVNKSTVPLNTASMIKSRQSNKTVSVVSNPEFLREGSAVTDFLDPSRIVIGSDDQISGEKVASLYLGLENRVYFTDPISAECIKYMSNGFLAMKISFINQVARFCDAVGADVTAVAKGVSMDPRIGNSFFNPGPGWGGSCFPKDTEALAATARYVGSPLSLIEESIKDNRTHQTEIAKLIVDLISKTSNEKPKIAALGLSFKANTDDTRVSPALKIISLIAQKSPRCIIHAYDPKAKHVDSSDYVRVSTVDEALQDSDIAIIFTEWPEFGQLSANSITSKMRGNVLVDTRYLLNRKLFVDSKLQIISLGNGPR